MSDYSKAVIYSIYCKDKNVLEFYIGSTQNEKQREQDHKSDCNNENCERHYNLKVYKHIRENGGWDNWIFKVIEEFPCDNDLQLRIREQYHYDVLKPLLNTYRPYVSEEELKEERKIRNAKYYLDNIEELIEKSKKYREYNRDEIAIYKAKYYLANIEEILKKNKQKNKQKHNCECGCKYTLQHKARHLDTKRHKKFILNRIS